LLESSAVVSRSLWLLILLPGESNCQPSFRPISLALIPQNLVSGKAIDE
jgi:hypothetical protein